MAKLRIHTAKGVRVYEILDAEVRVGRDAQNHIRLQSESVAPVHLRLRRTAAGGYRAEAAGADLRIAVNGEQVAQRDLNPGDRIALGGVEFEFVAEEAGRRPAARPVAPAPARRPSESMGVGGSRTQPPQQQDAGATPPSPAGAVSPLEPRAIVIPASPGRAGARRGRGGRDQGGAAREERRSRRGGGGRSGAGRWAMTSTLLVVAAAAVFVAVRLLQSGSDKSARELLALAQAQVQSGHTDRALATLHSAAQSQPDARTRQEIEQLKAHLEQVMQQQSDLPVLGAARASAVALQQFESVYLTKDPTHRPASREIVRRADAWLEQFSAVCNRHEEGRSHVQQVEAIRARYLPHARLDEPDTAADVLFAAERPLKVEPKRYKDAVALLDEWLARSGGTPEADVVRQQRAAIAGKAQQYVERELRFLEGELAKGKRDAVKARLQELRESALPEAVATIDAKLRELQ